MARITILGAGVCGLATGMLLARDRHDVTVLERDADPIPDFPEQAWQEWTRSGVAQFRQPHYLHPRVRQILEAELPDVGDALVAAGALRFDTLRTGPPSVPDFERRADDARFVTLTARRATIEHVIARAAAAEPRMEVRRGVAVSALATRGGCGVPHVTGVRTEAGEELTPWYRATVAGDRARLADMDAARTGSKPPASTDPAAALVAALTRAMAHDVDIFRAYMEIAGCLTPPRAVLSRPGFADRVLEVAARHDVAPSPGPTRDELLRLIG